MFSYLPIIMSFRGGGGVEEFVDTRFQHHCRLKAHSVICYTTTSRKLSSPKGGEGWGEDKSIWALTACFILEDFR